LIATRQFTEAGETLKKLRPNFETEYLAGLLSLYNRDFAAARAHAGNVLAVAPEYLPAWQLLASASEGKKYQQDSIDKLEAVLAAHSKSVPLHLLLGQWKIITGDNAAARREYESALRLQPENLDGQIRLAELDDMSGDNPGALRRAHDVTVDHPDSVRAQVVYAALLAKAGQGLQAATIYGKVLDVDPKNLGALTDLAGLLAPGDPQRALAYAKQAFEIDPENSRVLDTLGWVEYKLERYTDAATHLETAFKRNGKDARIAYHTALAQLKVGNIRAGDAALKTAQQEDPTGAYAVERPALHTHPD
jgi:tetratricopeptide (TPR) repeat protein